MKKRGLIIDGYNTAQKGYTMTSCTLEMPKIFENYVEVPGSHGALDFCEATTGAPVYQTRNLKATFELSKDTFTEREAEFSRLIRAVHGRRCVIEHPDHPLKTLTGRVSVTMGAHSLSYGAITVEAKCDPWFCDAAPSIVTIPLLPVSYNLATYDSIEVMDEIGTCGGAKVAETQFRAPSVSALNGDPQTYAVFRIKAEPYKSYYLSGSMNNTGFWRVGATAGLPEAFEPIVTTGDDGYIYVFVVRAKKFGGYAILQNLVCIDAAYVSVIENGDFPSEVIHTTSDNLYTLTLIGGVSHLNPFYQGTATLDSGEQLVASLCLGTDDAEDLSTSLRWQRRTLA